VDVADKFKEVGFFLADDGLKPILEVLTGSLMTSVKRYRITD
jgi:hypothetical protein